RSARARVAGAGHHDSTASAGPYNECAADLGSRQTHASAVCCKTAVSAAGRNARSVACAIAQAGAGHLGRARGQAFAAVPSGAGTSVRGNARTAAQSAQYSVVTPGIYKFGG
ncbi:MAG: hypothetical protein WA280_13020, partial [Xanthobacteraceae bacterium]